MRHTAFVSSDGREYRVVSDGSDFIEVWRRDGGGEWRPLDVRATIVLGAGPGLVGEWLRGQWRFGDWLLSATTGRFRLPGDRWRAP